MEKEIIIQCSSENEWLVGLFTIIGVFIGALINFFYRYFEKRSIRKAMIKSLFVEIAQFRHIEKRDLPETKSILEEFQQMYKSQKFICKPSVSCYSGEPERDYYDLYQSNIHLLKYDLRNEIVVFYRYMKGIYNNSKMLDDIFKRFYKNDKTIGGQDIIKYVEQLIKQMEMIDILGAEILAQLVVQYHTDKFKKSKENRQKVKDIQKYFKNKFQINDVVDVKKIAQKKKIDLLSIIIVLLETKQFIKIKYGLYKKIK